MINVALMGHGVVGSGVAEILLGHKADIAKKAKEEICLKTILDLRDFEELPYRDLFTKDFASILQDDSIRVVVEVMGGVTFAYEYVKACLLAGKSVVTSNKELVAAKGHELLQIAEEKNVNFLFEASVGGGIPVLRPMAQCLSANRISEVVGILNGTTNFILTKMVTENMPFAQALSLAQKLGYAEKDPTADIEGHDSCRKICILAALAFGRHVYPEQVSTEGISTLSLTDVEYADRFNCVIKLIGRAKQTDGEHITADVYPALINRSFILSGVHDVFNAIVVRGDCVGDVMFYGRGAGKMPTASAVVADVIDCVKHLTARKYLYWEEGAPDYVVSTRSSQTRLYVRATNGHPASAAVAIAKAFGDDSIFTIKNNSSQEIVFITPPGQESALRQKIAGLTCLHDPVILRVID